MPIGSGGLVDTAKEEKNTQYRTHTHRCIDIINAGRTTQMKGSMIPIISERRKYFNDLSHLFVE